MYKITRQPGTLPSLCAVQWSDTNVHDFSSHCLHAGSVGREEGMEGKQRYDGRRGGNEKEVTNAVRRGGRKRRRRVQE